MVSRNYVYLVSIAAALVATTSPADKTDEATKADETSLAMQLSNPVAALISVPMQLNYDQDIGPADDGDRWLLNVQPVIPSDLNDDWNLMQSVLRVTQQAEPPGGRAACSPTTSDRMRVTKPKRPSNNGQ